MNNIEKTCLQNFNTLISLKKGLTSTAKFFMSTVLVFIYSLTSLLVMLTVTKVAFPDQVGVFTKNGEFQSLGFMLNKQGHTELMGYWFIPVLLVLTCFCFLVIRLLKRCKSYLNSN